MVRIVKTVNLVAPSVAIFAEPHGVLIVLISNLKNLEPWSVLWNLRSAGQNPKSVPGPLDIYCCAIARYYFGHPQSPRKPLKALRLLLRPEIQITSCFVFRSALECVVGASVPVPTRLGAPPLSVVPTRGNVPTQARVLAAPALGWACNSAYLPTGHGCYKHV